ASGPGRNRAVVRSIIARTPGRKGEATRRTARTRFRNENDDVGNASGMDRNLASTAHCAVVDRWSRRLQYGRMAAAGTDGSFAAASGGETSGRSGRCVAGTGLGTFRPSRTHRRSGGTVVVA